MRVLLCFLCLLCPLAGLADTGESAYVFSDFGNGLYGLQFDSTNTKVTIVTTDTSLFLLEVSLSRQGGGAADFKEYREAGMALLETIREHFPNLAIAGVLHSHWHPHSLASVTPFLESGIPIVTTQYNFGLATKSIDSTALARYRDLVTFVEDDSLVIGEGENRIVAYRLQKKSYPSLPSEDYLYFYLPRHKLLQCGCMYNKWRGKPVAGREVLTTREVDLHKFITEKELSVDGLIRLYREEDSSLDLPFAGLQDVVANGITVREMTAPYRDLDAATLAERRETIVRELHEQGIPVRVFNSLAYRAAGSRELDRAKELALIQALADPSNANAWDTLGEIYYYLGDTTLARAFGAQSKKIDSTWSGGGESVWQQGLADLQERWAADTSSTALH